MKRLLYNFKYHFYNKRAFDAYNTLSASQHWSSDEWQAYESDSRVKLVRLAMERIPFTARRVLNWEIWRRRDGLSGYQY